MNFKANYPIYLQIAEDIKRRIVIGEIKPGDKLPSNADLSLEYHVNPNTIQRIYRQLESENISYTKRGIGTFIRNDEALPETLRQEIGKKISASYYSQMKQYHFTKDEMIRQIEYHEQISKKKEGSTC